MCNLKSTKTLNEILEYKKQLKALNGANKNIILFPSFIYLPFFYNSAYALGAQNVSTYKDGSHTGEVLAYQLATLKVGYVLVNHCETKETTESCVIKIQNATAAKIKVVLCLGRGLTKEDNNFTAIKSQVSDIFSYLNEVERNNCILAFEPAWAINQNCPLDSQEIEQTVYQLKLYIKEKYKINILVVYGGSVNIDTIDDLLKIDILDGYLIGTGINNVENLLKITEKL